MIRLILIFLSIFCLSQAKHGTLETSDFYQVNPTRVIFYEQEPYAYIESGNDYQGLAQSFQSFNRFLTNL